MTINIIHNISFQTGNIISASLTSIDECILLMDPGNVFRYNLKDYSSTYLFSTEKSSSVTYSDGGFDITAPCSIYTLDSIVVVVNNYKRHGFIHYPGKYKALHLWRGNYHVNICDYPIVLFKNELGVPHIIYGQDWNHIQIMNLETCQVLTAAKSLIEENAEERHLEYYEYYKESNIHPWPRAYDYFYGKLHLSPDTTKFLSAGWAWGSSDAYNVYDIEHFINNNRIKDIGIGAWEHENRGVCWIENDLVAVIYNPYQEGDEKSTKDSPCEIRIFKIENDDSEEIQKIPVPDIEVGMAIYYSDDLSGFVLFSDNKGFKVISREGTLLFSDSIFKPDSFYPALNLFIKVGDKTVTVYKIIN